METGFYNSRLAKKDNLLPSARIVAHVARTDAAHTLDVTPEKRLTVTLEHERHIYLPLVLWSH
jgi:hypothetical protein